MRAPSKETRASIYEGNFVTMSVNRVGRIFLLCKLTKVHDSIMNRVLALKKSPLRFIKGGEWIKRYRYEQACVDIAKKVYI